MTKEKLSSTARTVITLTQTGRRRIASLGFAYRSFRGL